MILIGLLLGGGEGGDAGGVGGFDDGVEVEYDGAVRLVAEVGEVEGNEPRLPLDSGNEFADPHLELDGIDVDDIVGTGVAGTQAGVEGEFYVETVGRRFPLLSMVARWELHPADQPCGEPQAGIVDGHRAVLVGEARFVDAGELVVLDATASVGLLGEPALDGGTEERGGALHGLEEGALPQLRFRFLVVDLRRAATAEGLAEAGVEDTVADGAGLFNDG